MLFSEKKHPNTPNTNMEHAIARNYYRPAAQLFEPAGILKMYWCSSYVGYRAGTMPLAGIRVQEEETALTMEAPLWQSRAAAQTFPSTERLSPLANRSYRLGWDPTPCGLVRCPQYRQLLAYHHWLCPRADSPGLPYRGWKSAVSY